MRNVMASQEGGNRLKTPVLFLIFNRPDHTRRSFAAIREARPARLYVAADGPRADRPGEDLRVKEARDYVINSVDWECEVRTLFRVENNGCKRAVSGAISWFFEHEEAGIILEDDCVAHPDFFGFCDTLLDYYKDDPRVWVITGNNYQGGRRRGTGAYYFSRYNHCWGWATWRRSWRHYDGDLSFWPVWKKSSEWRALLRDSVERRYWRHIFDSVYGRKFDAWGYPWTGSVWKHGGLTATPNVNLVTNIGIGPGATHTRSRRQIDGAPVAPLGPITHPEEVARDHEADRVAFDVAYGGRNLRFPKVIMFLPKRWLWRSYKWIRGNIERYI